MTISAELKIILKANDTIIAESTDPALWQKVLAAITKPDEAASLNEETSLGEGFPGGPLESFSKELDISVDTLIGACDPSSEAPYIHLDVHHWEALRNNTPDRGPKSISPIALSLTLLLLWAKHANLSSITIKAAQDVLNTIDLKDHNPHRSISNCEWLRNRGTEIVLNPALVSKAIAVTKAYCNQKAISE